jgi:ligand-binding sensor domain-containing protein/signal transduction histidine kinase
MIFDKRKLMNRTNREIAAHLLLKNKLIFVMLVLCLFNSELFPQQQNYRFEKFTSDDGLSQNSVVKIFQDSKHFLWFGTYDGLNRYDGFTFKVYKTNVADSTTISGQYFSAICEDKDGNLWVSSLGGGLNKYTRGTDTFKRYRHDPRNSKSLSNDRVRALLIDKRGNFWIGTESGLDLFNPGTEEFIHHRNIPGDPNSLSNDYVFSIGEDAKGNLWIGTYSGLNVLDPVKNKYRNFNGEKGLKAGLGNNWTNKTYLDRNNILWICSTEGLHWYDEKNDKFTRYMPEKNNPNSISNNNIRDILEDANGDFWIATNTGGINKFDKKTGKFIRIQHDPSNENSLNTDQIISLWQDKSGIIWIGTDGGGINKLNIRKSQFTIYQNLVQNKNSLSDNKVYYICEDKKGVLWIGTHGGGLNKFDPQKSADNFIRFQHRPENRNSLINDAIRWITTDRSGALWIATDSGLDKFNPATNIFTHFTMDEYPVLRTNSIFCVAENREGEILVGTYDGGFSIYDKTKNSFTNYLHDPKNAKSISSNVVRQIFEDKSGLIWLCTDNGLNLFNSRTKEFTRFLHDPKNSNSLSINTTVTIYQDKAGVIWIGTTLGLNKLEGNFPENKNIKFTRYTKKDGLPDNDIQAILEDDYGNLWISTNKGICKFNPGQNTFKNYNKNDGLPSNEFFINSACRREKTGEFLFGSHKGFCFFHPDSIKDDLYVPPVVLTDFQLFNKNVPINEEVNDEIILTQAIWETKEIHLSYRNNIISFGFAALDYASPGGNQYSYLLEGLESNWNFVGNRHYASYTNLPPGEYIFRVKGSNASGIWSGKDASVKIIVTPPYWVTWWFRVLVLIAIVLITVISFKIKVKGMEDRRKELERLVREKSLINDELKKLNDTKDKFFSILAHDLRNPFHSILGMISFIIDEYNTISDPERLEMLNMIMKASKNNFHLLDNLLDWSRSQLQDFKAAPGEIELEELITKNIELLRPLADDKFIEIESLQTPGLIVFADYYMIDLVIRNLISNAIKFTNTNGTIRIYSRLKKDLAQFQITDTGIGMSNEQVENLFSGGDYSSTRGTSGEKGTGLGIKLCKEFLKKNNGILIVNSTPGTGTTFSFELPIFKKEIDQENQD